MNVDFDSRVTTLTTEIKDNWEPKVKQMWLNNKQTIINGLIFEFGKLNFKIKLRNFIDLGNKPFSIISFHNKFFQQARYSFIIGSYYPALTATCALGERILNHLILILRQYYKDTPEYKKIYRKSSFNDWSNAIDVLFKWNILSPNTVIYFNNLKEIRNNNIHFNYSTDYNDRTYALNAIKEMNNIITEQFIAFGKSPWFIPKTKGAFYIKKSYEENPFIKEIYIPNCFYVGPNHKVTFDKERNSFGVVDNDSYANIDISDEEYVKLARKNKMA